MASIISSVKRKLALLSSLIVPAANAQDAPTKVIKEQSRPTKRRRLDGASTPMLRSDFDLEESPNLIVESSDNLKSPEQSFPSSKDENLNGGNQPSSLLHMLPPHVISKCLTYIADRPNRFALQTTSKMFSELSNEDDMLVDIDLGGDWSSIEIYSHDEESQPNPMLGGVLRVLGVERLAAFEAADNEEEEDLEDQHVRSPMKEQSVKGGILTDCDTGVSACSKLVKFSAAGNVQATYMLSMILCYCYENVSEGLSLLRLAASHGDLRSIYNLALILRDSRPTESKHWLLLAARYGYIPAWQEKLTPTEMRARFGDLDASTLSKYLDPPCLSRLLGRHYLECNRLNRRQTSHCWNPLCGRWAYKATSSSRRNQLLEESNSHSSSHEMYSIKPLLPELPNESVHQNHAVSPLGRMKRTLQHQCFVGDRAMKVSRMKMCSSCRRAKYCSKLCQVFDWRSGRHKAECPYLLHNI